MHSHTHTRALCHSPWPRDLPVVVVELLQVSNGIGHRRNIVPVRPFHCDDGSGASRVCGHHQQQQQQHQRGQVFGRGHLVCVCRACLCIPICQRVYVYAFDASVMLGRQIVWDNVDNVVVRNPCTCLPNTEHLFRVSENPKRTAVEECMHEISVHDAGIEHCFHAEFSTCRL